MSMKTVFVVVTAVVFLIVLLVAGSNSRFGPRPSTINTPPRTPAVGAHPSFLYGRVRTVDGYTYEGRLRWGGEEEAFWGDYFNGVRKENSWLAQVPPGGQSRRSEPIKVFGIEIARRERPIQPGRLFLMRFGDLARVEAHGTDVVVKLKSGTAFVLARSEASDFDDGVRIWDRDGGVVDLDSLRLKSIEFLDSGEERAAPPDRLFAKVHAKVGDFTGFVQWEKEQCLSSDELVIGDVKLRFDSIASIQRQAGESFEAILVGGRKATFAGGVLSGRGVYVDDSRYGRVLVSREAFHGVEFSAAARTGPAYGDFRKGGPLTGTVTMRDGRRLTGRLVYDLDESETTETLDAPSRGVNFNIPFERIASVTLPAAEQRDVQRATVTLRSGEPVELECRGDLGERNAGVLVFPAGAPQQPTYVPWIEVERIAFDPSHD